MDIFILQQERGKETTIIEAFTKREQAEQERSLLREGNAHYSIKGFPLLSQTQEEQQAQCFALFFFDRISSHEMLIGFYKTLTDAKVACVYYQGKYLFSQEDQDFRIQCYPLR